MAMRVADESDFAPAKGYVRFLLGSGALLIASALFHAVVFLLDETPWRGFVSWRKPIVFSLSFAITNFTLAWVLHLLPRSVWKGWLLGATFGVGACAEVGLITMQQWRGVPSHFNVGTPFDQNVVVALGALFVPLLLSLIGITIWGWISLPWDRNLALGMRIGMLFLIGGQVVGFMIVQHGIKLLIANQENIAALYPALNAFKVPHAICLHAIQVLCVIGVIADGMLTGRRRGAWIVVTASVVILVALGISLTGLP